MIDLSFLVVDVPKVYEEKADYLDWVVDSSSDLKKNKALNEARSMSKIAYESTLNTGEDPGEYARQVFDQIMFKHGYRPVFSDRNGRDAPFDVVADAGIVRDQAMFNATVIEEDKKSKESKTISVFCSEQFFDFGN